MASLGWPHPETLAGPCTRSDRLQSTPARAGAPLVPELRLGQSSVRACVLALPATVATPGHHELISWSPKSALSSFPTLPTLPPPRCPPPGVGLRLRQRGRLSPPGVLGTAPPAAEAQSKCQQGASGGLRAVTCADSSLGDPSPSPHTPAHPKAQEPKRWRRPLSEALAPPRSSQEPALNHSLV